MYPSQNKTSKAFTLAELLVVMALGLFIAGLSYPLFHTGLQRANFNQFATQLEGHLIAARRLAHNLDTSIRFEWDEQEPWAYRLTWWDKDHWREFSRAQQLPMGPRPTLPDRAINHPVSGKPLQRAFSSNHAPYVIFSNPGSSSATLVFSDSAGRVLCATISSRRGSFRLFKQEPGQSWQTLF